MNNLTQNLTEVITEVTCNTGFITYDNAKLGDFDSRTTKRLARHLRHNFKLAVADRKFLYNLGRRKLVTETQRLAVVCIADQLGVSVKGWLL